MKAGKVKMLGLQYQNARPYAIPYRDPCTTVVGGVLNIAEKKARDMQFLHKLASYVAPLLLLSTIIGMTIVLSHVTNCSLHSLFLRVFGTFKEKQWFLGGINSGKVTEIFPNFLSL